MISFGISNHFGNFYPIEEVDLGKVTLEGAKWKTIGRPKTFLDLFDNIPADRPLNLNE